MALAVMLATARVMMIAMNATTTAETGGSHGYSRGFPRIPEDSRGLPRIPEDSRGLPRIPEDSQGFLRIPEDSREVPKGIPVASDHSLEH